MKKTKKVLIVVLALLLIAALVLAGFLLWPKGTGGSGSTGTDALQVDAYPIVPSAYLNVEYDLRDAIEIEDGVTYTATAVYVDYDNGMTEHEVPVTDLKFTPTALYEVVVTVTAQRGDETAKKVLYIPVSIIADPIDQALSSQGSAAWADEGIVKTVTVNPDYIKAENSNTALEIAFNGNSSHYYGTAIGILKDDDLMELYSDQKWENAVLQFWVYNPMEEPIEFQLRIQDNQTGLNTDWSDAEDFEFRQIAQPGQWTLCLFSLRAQGTIHRLGNKETLVLKIQYHGMPGLNVNYAYNCVIDGLDIVDASNYPDLDTTFTKSTETLDQGWENLPLDTGWQGTNTVYDHEIMMGEGTACSLKATFDGPKSLTDPFISFAPQWAVAYGKMRELPDMSGGTLTAYFKFENMPASVELGLTNRDWESSNQLPFTLEKLEDGWYKGTIDLYDLEFAAAERSDNIIRFNLYFTGVSKNSVVYVDTMKFEYKEVNKVKEPANKDWINLPVDTGMSEVSTYKYNTSYLKASGSVRAIYVKAPSNASGKITFSQEWAVRYETLSSLPDMRTGVLHGYFYFGNQAPKATAQIFNTEWRNSTDVEFIFESVGNGWYYGSIPNVLFKGFEKGSAKDIIRIEITVPAGYSVYIDGLMSYPNETYSQDVDLEDLLGTGIVGVANLTANGGSKVVTDVTNGSDDAMYIYATGDTNYPLLTSRFVLPVDASQWDNLSFDVRTDNASSWVGMRVYYQDSTGAEKTASVGTDVTPGVWNTVTVDLSAFKNVDWKKVTGFGLQFNMDKEDGGLKSGTNKIYIDNWKLTKDAPLPDDPDDLLGDATLTGGSFFSNPALYKAENDVTVMNGAASTRSWKFSVTEKAWPTAQFTFAGVQDLTGKTVQFDVKFAPLADVTDHFERIDVILLGAGSAALHEYILNTDVYNGAVTANADGWYTITLDLTGLDFDRTAVHGIQLRFNFDQFEAIYIDNMKLVEQAEEVPELPADPDDLLGDATLTGGSFYSNTALYIAQNDQTVKNGTTSTRSWKFSVTEKAWPTAQFTFAGVQDLTGKTVQFDVKFAPLADVTDHFERIDVILLGTGSAALHEYILNTDVYNGAVTANADGWYTITLDLAGLDFDRTAVHGIQLRFNFDQFEAIYIDNMKLVEEAEEVPELPADPADLLSDATMTSGSYVNNPDVYKYETDSSVVNGTESTRSWKLSAASGWPQAFITFAEKQDLTDKALQFDVKFVEKEGATNRWIGIYLLDSEGNKLFASQPVDSCKDGSLAANADGWYTVTLDFENVTFDRTDVATVYLCFDFDSMNEVYLDNMKLVAVEEAPEPPVFNAEDLIASATIDDVTGLNVELVTDKTNGSDEALYIHSETPAGYPVVKLMFTGAQDISAYDNLSLDGITETASRWIGLRLYYLDANGDQQTAGIGIDLAGADWDTQVVALSKFTGADLSKVVGVGLCLNFHETEGFVTGQNNQVWIDNVKLTVDPPVFNAEDLIASATIDDVTGLNVELVTDKTNGSDEALYIHSETPAGYPVVKLMFTGAQDISAYDNLSLDGITETASRWIGLRLYYLDANGDQQTAGIGIDLAGADWDTQVVALSKFTGADLTKVVGVGLCLNFHETEGFVTGQNNQVWIDNVKLTVDPAEDLDDLLSDATMTSGSYINNPDVYKYETDSSVVNGTESTRSWKLSAASGWPQAFITFAEKQDLTNKALQFDVKFVEKEGATNRWIGIYLLDSEGNKLFASQPVDSCKDGSLTANADGWYTVNLNFGTVDFDRTDVATVYLCFDFDSMNEVYLDNMKLVDWTPPAPEPEFDITDVMPTSQITGITATDTLTVTTVTDDTFHSDDAVKVSATAKSAWPVLKIMFEETQDLSEFTELTFAAKSVNASKWLGLRIFYLDANNETKTASLGYDLSGNDAWEQCFVSLSQFSGLDKTKVVGVGFCFNFDDGFVADQTNSILIDAVGFCGTETVAQDWINMRVDGGYSAGTYYLDITNVKAENSTKSLKLEAPANGSGIAALNAQWAAGDGSLSARPDLTAGTVGAWFYFGSQTPYAGLSVVNSGWAVSETAPFTFGEGEDGWYYGTVDVSTITFSNATATAAECLRVRVSVPAGYSVNVDGMTYTKPAASEETEKASDLLASAKLDWHNMVSGIDSYETSTDVNGDQSLRSWKFTTSGESGGNGWPVATFKLDKSYDMTGKNLVLDIKFEGAAQWFSVYSLENSSWVKVGGSYGVDVTGSGWQTVTVDLSSKIAEGKTLEDVYLISFCFNFDSNAGQPQTVWIDNVRLVDAQ